MIKKIYVEILKTRNWSMFLMEDPSYFQFFEISQQGTRKLKVYELQVSLKLNY